jgi:hypothetical protein
MRQIAQATGYTAPTRSHHMIVFAALLAFLATAAVVLAVAVGNNTADSRLTDQPVSAVRGDGGPEETAAAAVVGGQTSVVRPDESSIAAAVSSADEPTPGPRQFGGAIASP